MRIPSEKFYASAGRGTWEPAGPGQLYDAGSNSLCLYDADAIQRNAEYAGVP